MLAGGFERGFGLVPVGEVSVSAGVGVVAEGGGDVVVPLVDAIGRVDVGVGSLSETVDDVPFQVRVDEVGVGEEMIESPVDIAWAYRHRRSKRRNCPFPAFRSSNA